MKRNNSFGLCFAVALVLLMLSSCGIWKQSGTLSVDRVLPINTSVDQGLSVYFRYSFYRHINQMASEAVMLSEGEVGQPVVILDHQFQENIFDSKRAKGVGVFLTGYLKMDTPGKYRFKAMSNDGIQVAVNEVVVVHDPTVHSDRFSEVGEVTVVDPGWYPLTVKYFQRKGTARLTLYWQPPGAMDFEIVPAAVYGH